MHFSFYLKTFSSDMKHTKTLILSLLAVLSFSACADEDSYLPGYGKGDNKKDNTGGSTEIVNTNKNVATASMPAVVKNAIGSLEFPKVKGGTSYVVVHTADGEVNFSSEWDNDIHAQRWTCYNYNKSNKQDNNVGRAGSFMNDPDLSSLYPGITEFDESPYSRSGYDRGHMLASDERQKSVAANKQTFYFTNMQPQYSQFNQNGAWKRMEEQVAKWTLATDRDTLFVTKGGTIEGGNVIEYIHGTSKVSAPKQGYIPVPKYFFVAFLKKTYDTKTQSFSYHAFGYWFEHKDTVWHPSSTDNLGNYIVNIDDLEKKTGIDFFCNLPDDIEQQVQSASVANIKTFWGF